MGIYLDYNASAPIDEVVLETMIDVYRNHVGNADSRTHDYGDQAREIVENARKQVASLLGISSGEVFFTSGATESNNIAIQGLEAYAAQTGKNHIITSSIEHKAVLETVKAMSEKGFEIDIIDPEKSGQIDPNRILSRVKENTLLVSLMHVNNETGIIQPIEKIGQALCERKVLFHIDATQSCGKLVDELRKVSYYMLSFSAHKLRGPQGIGALVLRKRKYKLPPVKAIMYGGQQEHGIRPGTIPVALVAGCGKACELAENTYVENLSKVQFARECIITLLNKSGIKYMFNGDQKYCISNTLNICLEGVASEALMLASKNYCGISNGSACTSKSYAPSYVLTAMGLPLERIENSIRISWGPDTDINLLKTDFKKLIEVAKMLAQ